MIHELLFNLWNNPGNGLISDDNDWTHHFELPQFLHPAEETLLQSIIQIGANYHKITSFTNEILSENCISNALNNPRSTEEDLNTKIQNGLYLKAFCNGVQDALEDYRKEIIRLENTFLEYPQLSLSYVLSAVDKYKGLFTVLKSMISKIQLENLYGCLLMSGLQKYIACGIDQLEKAASIILKAINTVFYQHLCNWVICGDLVDPYSEFFICDGKVADENFLYPEQISEKTAVSLVNKIKRPPIVRKFYINWDMVPKFISQDSAESILFMGRIVWILRNDPQKMEYTGDYQTKFRRDIWEGKEIEFYNKIRSVGDQSLSAGEFRPVIEECRSKLTKYLWSVMLKEGNLVEHLKLIREYYALGRGELFQQFLAVSNVKDVPSDSLLQQINTLFHETARKIYGENDKSYLRFELTCPSSQISRTKLWQSLHLNFEMQWPLHIIFHPEVIGFYNKLFSFLLRLKKTQINLFKLWTYHTFSQHKIDRRVWMLRQNLLFLVDNLQYYIQVNVIEAKFSILMKAVQSANELEDVIKIHHEFVVNLLSESFLLSLDEPQESGHKHRLYQMPVLQHNPPSKVYNIITRLLELCDEFCLSAKSWEAELTEPDLEEFDTFQKRTDIIIDTLLVLLYSLHGKVRGNHLLQLVLHLDFNKYFSRNKTDLNLTEAFKIS
ncbi:gamma-tubulin complex component 4 [Euwallacea fornicatus]|uniref:gamma-tubulin complex component 4 n=1 Tax=Euwallacea fornicatus TaxID=995702 RepID=UPI0033904136